MSEEKIVKSNSTPSELTDEQVSNAAGGIVIDASRCTEGLVNPSKPYIAADDNNLLNARGHKTKIGARLDALVHGDSPLAYTPEEIMKKMADSIGKGKK